MTLTKLLAFSGRISVLETVKTTAIIAACVLGFLGVALGAFGAHGLSGILTENGTVETYKTASHYHLIHALLLFMVGLEAGNRESKWLKTALWAILAGVFLFSGSLYLMSVTNIKWLGAITPLGGVAFLTAWATCGLHMYQFYRQK